MSRFIDTARPVCLGEYHEDGDTRWIVEANYGEGRYAQPAWDEMGFSDLMGPFESEAEARAAIADARSYA